MAKRVILAVAGAGKTYHICHNLDLNKRNLILAFSHENIHNIRRELLTAYGKIPDRTTVSTFDSFVYHNFVLPYEPSIAKHFGRLNFKSQGVCITPPPSKHLKTQSGQHISNPHYVRKKFLDHYITKNNQYYCETLSELALQVKRGRSGLIKRAVARLNIFFDNVFVDEFQDFRGYDYTLILEISKYLRSIILVGDYYQHSVSAVNNSGKPFDRCTTYETFIQHLKNEGFEVDQTSLVESRRCSKEICTYVTKKLGINIISSGINNGRVIWADNFAEEILANREILKLVYKNARKFKFRAMNWSYSKGDTVKAACVILTGKLETLDSESFSPVGIPVSTLNKLYVAMTRSSGDLYLIKSSTLEKISHKDGFP